MNPSRHHEPLTSVMWTTIRDPSPEGEVVSKILGLQATMPKLSSQRVSRVLIKTTSCGSFREVETVAKFLVAIFSMDKEDSRSTFTIHGVDHDPWFYS